MNIKDNTTPIKRYKESIKELITHFGLKYDDSTLLNKADHKYTYGGEKLGVQSDIIKIWRTNTNITHIVSHIVKNDIYTIALSYYKDKNELMFSVQTTEVVDIRVKSSYNYWKSSEEKDVYKLYAKSLSVEDMIAKIKTCNKMFRDFGTDKIVPLEYFLKEIGLKLYDEESKKSSKEESKNITKVREIYEELDECVEEYSEYINKIEEYDNEYSSESKKINKEIDDLSDKIRLLEIERKKKYNERSTIENKIKRKHSYSKISKENIACGNNYNKKMLLLTSLYKKIEKNKEDKIILKKIKRDIDSNISLEAKTRDDNDEK